MTGPRVNVVVLAGTVSGEPVTRRREGREEIELRVSVKEDGELLLPLPVVVDFEAPVRTEPGSPFELRKTVEGLKKGDQVLVHGKMIRRFERTSNMGAVSRTEVLATGVKLLQEEETDG